MPCLGGAPLFFKDVTFSLCPHVEEGEGIPLGVIYKVTDLDHEDHEGSTHNSSLCKAAPSIVLHWGGGEHSDDKSFDLKIVFNGYCAQTDISPTPEAVLSASLFFLTTLAKIIALFYH